MMKNRVAAASLLAMCLISSANAQFIDERASKPAATQAPMAPASMPSAKPGDQYPYKSETASASFDVRSGDQTIREVLVRWATSAGWAHNPDHWTIDRDLPIAGTADASVFGGDFKEATRRLLSSTELTDRPVQPCFYSNRILRVVAKAELCDKTGANN